MIKCTLCNETCSISKLLTNKYSCLMLEIFPQEKSNIKKINLCLTCLYLTREMCQFAQLRTNKSSSKNLCFTCGILKGEILIRTARELFNYLDNYLSYMILKPTKNRSICLKCLYNTKIWHMFKMTLRNIENGCIDKTQDIENIRNKLSHLKNTKKVVNEESKNIRISAPIDDKMLNEIPYVLIYKISESVLKEKTKNFYDLTEGHRKRKSTMPVEVIQEKIVILEKPSTSPYSLRNSNKNESTETNKKVVIPKESAKCLRLRYSTRLESKSMDEDEDEEDIQLDRDEVKNLLHCTECKTDFSTQYNYKLHMLKHARPGTPFVRIKQQKLKQKKNVSFEDCTYILNKWLESDVEDLDQTGQETLAEETSQITSTEENTLSNNEFIQTEEDKIPCDEEINEIPSTEKDTSNCNQTDQSEPEEKDKNDEEETKKDEEETKKDEEETKKDEEETKNDEEETKKVEEEVQCTEEINQTICTDQDVSNSIQAENNGKIDDTNKTSSGPEKVILNTEDVIEEDTNITGDGNIDNENNSIMEEREAISIDTLSDGDDIDTDRKSDTKNEKLKEDNVTNIEATEKRKIINDKIDDGPLTTIEVEDEEDTCIVINDDEVNDVDKIDDKVHDIDESDDEVNDTDETKGIDKVNDEVNNTGKIAEDEEIIDDADENEEMTMEVEDETEKNTSNKETIEEHYSLKIKKNISLTSTSVLVNYSSSSSLNSSTDINNYTEDFHEKLLSSTPAVGKTTLKGNSSSCENESEAVEPSNTVCETSCLEISGSTSKTYIQDPVLNINEREECMNEDDDELVEESIESIARMVNKR